MDVQRRATACGDAIADPNVVRLDPQSAKFAMNIPQLKLPDLFNGSLSEGVHKKAAVVELSHLTWKPAVHQVDQGSVQRQR